LNFEGASGSRLGDDTIYGTDGENIIKTFDGADTVYDRGGNDTVELGKGDDTLYVGGGQDSYDGGAGFDYISYIDSLDGVTVDLRENTSSGSFADDDTFINFEGVSGSDTGDDLLRGTADVNTLRGHGGVDTLYGRAGADQLYGGADNDTLYGGSGHDTLKGGKGLDTVDGGTGDDMLYGGSSSDTFYFQSGDDDDTILDFENNTDVIRFDGYGYLTDADDALTYATAQNGDVMFDFGADGTVLVQDVTIGQLRNDIDIV